MPLSGILRVTRVLQVHNIRKHPDLSFRYTEFARTNRYNDAAMAGETILVVDDSAMNLKLAAITLRTEGYRVETAMSGAEALEVLKNVSPSLILADVQMPGMDGLELARRIKGAERTRDILTVALTASAMKIDEENALAAGCDGYITKPIDTRTLGARVRAYLETRAPATEAANPVRAETAPFDALPLTKTEIENLRRRFLTEGSQKSRQLLSSMDDHFDASCARHILHQWVGAAGLLGYAAIAESAAALEELLRLPPWPEKKLREALTNLAYAFSEPSEAEEAPLPESVVTELTGKRIALIAFGDEEADRVCAALARVAAKPMLFDAEEPETSAGVRDSSVVIVHVRAGTLHSRWLEPGHTSARPLILMGRREDVAALDRGVQARACELLLDDWQPEEALMRLGFALARPAPESSAHTAAQSGPRSIFSRTQVLVADDDPTTLTVVRSTLQNYGMECHVATSGTVALQMIRDFLPPAAVLDVNMPGMNGYEVLARVRAEDLPVRILLLTARGTEGDIVQGFTLGADDYVVKPFSGMELVFRVKRLLREN
jgi:two-component system cell cycle response regulator DivK